MKDEMMDTRTAAAYLRVAPQTLARWRVEGGKIPFYKAGRRVLYEKAELERWLDARHATSTSDVGTVSDATASRGAARANGRTNPCLTG